MKGSRTDLSKLCTRKKSRKATALAVMATELQAAAAASSVCGDPAAPLLVTPLLKLAPTATASVGQLAEEELQPRAATGDNLEAEASDSGALPKPISASLFPLGGRPTAVSTSSLFPCQPCFPVTGGSAPHAASSFPSFSGFGRMGGASSGNFEAAVLDKMKREAERKRALAAAEAEEAAAG